MNNAMVYEKYSKRIRGKLETLNKLYASLIYEKVAEMSDIKGLVTKEHLRTPPKDSLENITKGFRWGGEYMNLWLVGSFTVPYELSGKKLSVIPKTGAYETLFFKGGVPDGIINSKGDYMGIMHSAQVFTKNAVCGERFDLAFECYAHHYVAGYGPYENYGKDYAAPGEFDKTFESVDICVVNETIYKFVFDLNIVLQMAEYLKNDNFLKAKAQDALERVFAEVIQYPIEADKEDIEGSLKKCITFLAPCLEKSSSDVSRGEVFMIGHSHMDTAWLWPVDETIRKCARTYSNVCKLMEQYPEYKFIQSSALHADWMRRYYPDIFEKMCKYVKEGRYEPNGGVWVECDCNITSGELMARQFMYGQHFTRQYYNYTSDSFWLPDTFGYNAAIPQIMLESEVKYFFTTKMGWNDLNEFPLTSFIWKGIDGSSVITHLHNIDVQPDVKDIMAQVDYNKNKQDSSAKLLPFGHGDGGGGPTPALLEKARRVTDIPGLCNVHYGTASEFMQKLEERRAELPVFSGELYLELHRGTLTQMHDMKRSNRKCEIALHDMDYMNVISKNPKNENTDELYKVLLKNQFHDILPGTCYTGVTQKAVFENNEVIQKANSVTSEYAKELTSSDKDALSLFNTTSFERQDCVKYQYNGKFPESLPSQIYTDLAGKKVTLFSGVKVPALGSATVKLSNKASLFESPFEYDSESKTLSTPYAKVSFDENGAISSFFDKTHRRELGKKGSALNTFLIAEDVPNYWDNWDIDFETMTKLKKSNGLISFEVISDGPCAFIIREKHKIGKASTLTQDVIFYANTQRVDFHTVIDWNERHTLLKASFDLDINSSTVKNEIQFGHIDRPTTRNNSLEAAKFEVCNHKWSDISESRFGVALLNDCKYGISAYDNNLCLTLHRGGTRPDITGDKGVHEMTYSLYPHDAFSTSNVIKEAYLLNIPCVIAEGSTSASPFITLSADNIICEAIKPAALVKDAVVARLYEAERNKTLCEISIPEGYKKVYRVNILEDVKEDITPENKNTVELTFDPFRIISLMFVK